jgi:hypothetical protein
MRRVASPTTWPTGGPDDALDHLQVFDADRADETGQKFAERGKLGAVAPLALGQQATS